MPVRAQGGDPELNQLQSQRRIVLKGGVVLTLDRQVGDFAEADLLIEDGKICEIRPNIAVSIDAAAVVDASNRIIIPGFVDTHSHSYQGLVRNIMPNGLLNPDYNRDIQTTLTPVLSCRRCLCRRTPHRARFHRDGHDGDRRHFPVQPHARTQRCHDPRAIGDGHPRGLFLSSRRRRQAPVSAGYPIRPDDAHLYPGFLARTDPEDLRLRFLAPRRNFPEEMAIRLTQLDDDREMAFVALTPDGELAGVAPPSPATPTTPAANTRPIVRSDLKGVGLGRALMRMLIDYAAADGLRRLEGIVLAREPADARLSCGASASSPSPIPTTPR